MRMQLEESSERECNLRRMNENILNAIQTPREDSPVKEVVNEEHPRVREMLREKEEEHRRERLQWREREMQWEKEMQQMRFEVEDWQRKCSNRDEEVRGKETQVQDMKRDRKSGEERVRAQGEGVVRRLEGEVARLNADMERQVLIRVNQKYAGEQELNAQIIRY